MPHDETDSGETGEEVMLLFSKHLLSGLFFGQIVTKVRSLTDVQVLPYVLIIFWLVYKCQNDHGHKVGGGR